MIECGEMIEKQGGSTMVEGMRVEFKREYAETIRKTVKAEGKT